MGAILHAQPIRGVLCTKRHANLMFATLLIEKFMQSNNHKRKNYIKKKSFIKLSM